MISSINPKFDDRCRKKSKHGTTKKKIYGKEDEEKRKNKTFVHYYNKYIIKINKTVSPPTLK